PRFGPGAAVARPSKLVNHQEASVLADHRLDRGVLMPGDEHVGLGVGPDRLVVRDADADRLAARGVAAFAQAHRLACPLDAEPSPVLAQALVGAPEEIFILDESLLPPIHAADLPARGRTNRPV